VCRECGEELIWDEAWVGRFLHRGVSSQHGRHEGAKGIGTRGVGETTRAEREREWQRTESGMNEAGWERRGEGAVKEGTYTSIKHKPHQDRLLMRLYLNRTDARPRCANYLLVKESSAFSSIVAFVSFVHLLWASLAFPIASFGWKPARAKIPDMRQRKRRNSARTLRPSLQ
jgi:hypothetical protein